MENIKVGNYAKHTKDGYMGKIISFNDVFVNLDTGKTCFRQYIKTAENIIDLIEVGDYVNGYKVVNIIDNEYLECGFDGDWQKTIMLYKSQIKSIVTKEAFAQMEYKVGE